MPASEYSLRTPALLLDYSVSTWRRRSESNRKIGFFQNPLLCYYHPATRGVHPHNYRTPIESGVFAHLSSTRHYAPKTNHLPTKYSFTTRSLALSLALGSRLR